MGRETKNFRQSAKSMSGTSGNRNYSGINTNVRKTKEVKYFKMQKGDYGKS